jgi:exodeoxyribonuclease V alpha subunit
MDQIYFKGLIEYLNWYLSIPKNTALDISSNVDLDNLNTLFEVDLKYYLPEAIIDKLKTQVSSLPLKPTSYLLGIGFSPKIVEQIIKYYGPSDSLISVVEKNPYDLLSVEAVSFKRLDKIALEVLNIDPDSEFRQKAFILYQLDSMCNKNGHVFIDLDKFINSKFEIDINKSILKKYLIELIQNKKIYLQGKKLYTAQLYKAETESAEVLASLLRDKDHCSFFKDIDPETFIKGYEDLQTENIQNGKWKNLSWNNSQFSLSQNQRLAIKKFILDKFLIITGLPGTGKTSCLKSLVDISKSRGLRICLMAPTGIAAKRLAEATGCEATTIHKKLGFDGVSWNIKENSYMHDDIIIVDEFSMVDQVLIHKLLTSLPKKEFKIVFVGDSDQLPSVAPGNVLKELISSGRLPHIHLDKIFRQEDTSDIIINSHLINKGISNLVSKKNDFIFIETSDEDKSLEILLKIIDKVKDRDFQVLSPTYKGVLGVTNLNNILQEVLNPKLDEVVFKTDQFEFKIDDRVMVLKNDYQNEVYNGEQGFVRGIKTTKKLIQIEINNKLIEYSFKDAYSVLTLDYCRTVHKSQAQEYDFVILPWVNEFSIQLQRNLLYTAITRAKNKVFMIGNKEALKSAIKNNNTSKRNSILSSRILTNLENLDKQQ